MAAIVFLLLGLAIGPFLETFGLREESPRRPRGGRWMPEDRCSLTWAMNHGHPHESDGCNLVLTWGGVDIAAATVTGGMLNFFRVALAPLPDTEEPTLTFTMYSRANAAFDWCFVIDPMVKCGHEYKEILEMKPQVVTKWRVGMNRTVNGLSDGAQFVLERGYFRSHKQHGLRALMHPPYQRKGSGEGAVSLSFDTGGMAGIKRWKPARRKGKAKDSDEVKNSTDCQCYSASRRE